MAQMIDDEVKDLVDRGYNDAKKILTDRLNDLHTLAKSLLEYETLTGDEITTILKGDKIRAEDASKESGEKYQSTLDKYLRG
jgi:cell division protease FtsH